MIVTKDSRDWWDFLISLENLRFLSKYLANKNKETNRLKNKSGASTIIGRRSKKSLQRNYYKSEFF